MIRYKVRPNLSTHEIDKTKFTKNPLALINDRL